MITVWNISDHPGKGVQAKTIHMFGKAVLPGKCIQLPDERKAMATALVGKLPVYGGDTPPTDYLYAKGAYKVGAPRGTRRSQVQKPTAAVSSTEVPAVTPTPEEPVAELKPVLRKRGRRRLTEE